MRNISRVAVTSRVFSRNALLREELQARYGEVRFNTSGRLTGAELAEFLRGYDKAIVSLERIDEQILSQVPELKVISKYGVGLDNLDFEALEKHGVSLGWRGGVNRRSVSELALSFTLALLRHVPQACESVRRGLWEQKAGLQLSNRTVGVIGCGNIGQDLISLLGPFGCEVLAYDIRHYGDFYREFQVQPVSIEELLRRSDVVSLHLPYDRSTHLFLNADRLSMMKASAILVNTARGNLVDESALKQMLFSGRLGGAGFDVFASEPPTDVELLNHPNFLCTPHIGGTSEEGILAMGRQAIAGLESPRPVSEWRRELDMAR